MPKTPSKVCHLCEEGVEAVDYKDPDALRRFISPQGRINPRARTGCCAKHQRSVARSVKKARVLGLLPFQTK